MKSALPPLDLHAHMDVGVPSNDLRDLRAVIFAATRSLAEARVALERQDDLTVWGVGSHPALASSHGSFDGNVFRDLIERTAFVGEFGLDGRANVPFDLQLQTLTCALDVLSAQPRITSLHSYGASDELLRALADRPIRGVVLHWWLGSASATEQAAESGYYFSVNAAMCRRPGLLRQIPLDQLLTETDHPYGDVSGPEPHRPGSVLPVEYAIGRLHGLEPEEVRRVMWRNLYRLVGEVECMHLLARRVRSFLIVSA